MRATNDGVSTQVHCVLHRYCVASFCYLYVGGRYNVVHMRYNFTVLKRGCIFSVVESYVSCLSLTSSYINFRFIRQALNQTHPLWPLLKQNSVPRHRQHRHRFDISAVDQNMFSLEITTLFEFLGMKTKILRFGNFQIVFTGKVVC